MTTARIPDNLVHYAARDLLRRAEVIQSPLTRVREISPAPLPSDDLRAAYPKMFAYPRPPTEDEHGDDNCMARSSALRGVGWVYSWCKQAEQGEPAKRVDLWIPE